MPSESDDYRAMDEFQILFTAVQIEDRVRQLGEELTKDFAGETPIFVAVMQGAVIFFADLIRHVQLDLLCDFVSVSSYGDEMQPAGDPLLLHGPRHDWRGRAVVFVEAVVDTGSTARLLYALAEERSAQSVTICALLDKPSRRSFPLRVDYKGFTAPDVFVVGYGLDYAGRMRNLPEIGLMTRGSIRA